MSTELPSDEALLVVARELALVLERKNLQLVLAESCTAGLAAAQLARIPGVSRFFCGSAVVYQEATKTAWLGVPASHFESDGPGVVSGETAAAMAEGVLERTPQADFAVAITGHLGPGAPVDLDGLAFHGWATRDSQGHVRHRLPKFPADLVAGASERELRQRLAAWQLLRTAIAVAAETRGVGAPQEV